ncbi:hypothetical protein HS088_TW01G00769 [Tripterygium wilfordii]|uniref:Uncharacterized protein n=1 Tax=Tripterygium wilfordii TaxID=458696 RepID=A0A7J7E2V4_TRIWF|nr:hypothetical protein HS088_TW01G00769 [Tripterygium wilfordii]
MGAGTTNPDYFDFNRYATVDGYAYDLIAILEKLQIETCIFVGHSMSAMVGAVGSITRPDLFTKLVCLSASPRFLNAADYYEGFEQEEIDQLLAWQHRNRITRHGVQGRAVGGRRRPGVGARARVFQDPV